MFLNGNMVRAKRQQRRRPPTARETIQERARQQVVKCLAASGLTQTALGERLSPKRRPAWVSRYLRGEIDADIDTLTQLVAIFKCSYEDLFGEPSSSTNGGDEQREAVALRRRLDKAYATMTDSKRQLLVILAETFAEPLLAPRRGPTTPQRSE